MSKEKSDTTTSVNLVVHTPGPWERQGTTIRGTRNDLGRQGVIADTAVHHSNQVNMQPEHEANARLIAAAPELLAACQYLMECISEGTTQVFEQDAEYGQSPITGCELIEAAIKKATSVV